MTNPNRFRLYIETENAAFDEVPEIEIANILRSVADRVEQGAVRDYHKHLNLRDSNGNVVGTFVWKQED